MEGKPVLHSPAGHYNFMLLAGPLNFSASISRDSLALAAGYTEGWVEEIVEIKAADRELSS